MRMGIPTPKPIPRPNPKVLLVALLEEEEEEEGGEEEEVGLAATVRVGVGVGVRVVEGVGDTTGSTTVAGTVFTALRRESVESKPSELATPACCTARVREPSESLLLTRASRSREV